MKVSNLLIFCYSFLFGLPLIFGQQARQIPFYTTTIEYSTSLEKLIVYGRFPTETERKTYTLDPATLEFEEIAAAAVPTDAVSNLHPNYKSHGIISIKLNDFPDVSTYQTEFYDTFLDTNSNLLYLPLKRFPFLKLYVIDADRLTLQKNISFPNIPNEIRNFAQLPGGINFAYATSNKIIIIQECNNAPSFPASTIPDTLFACEFNGIQFISPPSGYDHLYYHNQTNYEEFDKNIYTNAMPTTEEGNYELRVADEAGCLSQAKLFTLKRPGAPNTPIFKALSPVGDMVKVDATSDTTPQCEGEMTMLTASQNRLNNNIIYVWSNGDTGAITYVTEPGTYWVEAHNADGCSSKRSNELEIYKLDKSIPSPPPILPVGDSLDICRTDEETFLKTEGDYFSYVWYTDKNTFPSKGPTVRIDKRASKVYLRGRKNGCWSDFTSQTVHFSLTNSLPAKINKFDNILASNKSGKAYRWYHNEVLIPDSNKIVWETEVAGAYQVSVFNGVCWTALSAKVYVS